MRWPWRHEARPIEPRPMVSRALELQTAKEILAEVLHARPGEVEEILQRRLEERSRHERGGGRMDFNSCRTLAINRLPTYPFSPEKTSRSISITVPHQILMINK